MAVSWNWDTVWPAANDFYRRVESVLGSTFFHPRTAIRLFQSEEERTAFEQRRDMLAPYVEPLPAIDLPHPFGGFAMPNAAVLDVKTYLAASHAFFRTIDADIDPQNDLIIRSDSVSLPRFEIEAAFVAFCQGYAGRGHPAFPWITFNPTRGDILSLEIPGFADDRIVHAGGWLARMPDGSYRAGSTYERERLDPIPDATGRAEVERIVRNIIDRPFTCRRSSHGRAADDSRKPARSGHSSVSASTGLFQRPRFKGIADRPVLCRDSWRGRSSERDAWMRMSMSRSCTAFRLDSPSRPMPSSVPS